ncbi:gamma-glutamyltransferase [Paremcibacter congregatus]|uniref:Glutathione hydrolase proenzyme n=2 Tax=Paremcibacter congregatus TaxID=2043170 RepID=A0A2G4YSX0_9PROT|nr:gamma-glutamyltransferase [Paremcibacter congregatus]QDE29262.1 gamma-glutamyltransferase [Paremcibacter congregatus]
MVFVQFPAVANDTPIITYQERFIPVIAKNGMVASQERMATEVGVEIMRQGGNAVDAAVAVGFALAVTLPQAGNLAGGGFMMVHLAEENKTIAIDYRELAPRAAHKDVYLDAAGQVDQDRLRFSHQSAGVPGTVAGMVHALEKYGTMELRQVIAPAIRLAEQGFDMPYWLEISLGSRQERLQKDPAAGAAFFHENGRVYAMGERFRQPDLAWSLKQIRDHGRDGFYKGAIADKIVANMEKNNGLITRVDLANYKVVERTPIRGTYKGYEIATMPPPSSGGIHLVQMLNMLEGDNLKGLGHNSAASLHLLIESMRQAYADRSKYLGDPDFFDVPMAELTDKAYAQKLRAMIPADRARTSAEVAPALGPKYESPDTTHYSVMDSAGNVVSNTYTLNYSYGSGIMVPGAGFLLNNEMDDFSAKPGVPNGFGLVGGKANAVEAGKRPLSSMTPTIVFKDGKALLATGSPGGSTIITVVFQTILNMIEFDMNIAAATFAPRLHHQWLPDKTFVEQGVSADTLAILKAMGHNIDAGKRTLGSTQSITRKDGFFYGASDSRRLGALTRGY